MDLVGYHIVIRRDPKDHRWVRARMTRSWWRPFMATRYTQIAETWFDAGDARGDDLASDALRELLLALEDRLS